jgi:hypothetical protein
VHKQDFAFELSPGHRALQMTDVRTNGQSLQDLHQQAMAWCSAGCSAARS